MSKKSPSKLVQQPSWILCGKKGQVIASCNAASKQQAIKLFVKHGYKNGTVEKLEVDEDE